MSGSAITRNDLLLAPDQFFASRMLLNSPVHQAFGHLWLQRLGDVVFMQPDVVLVSLIPIAK